MTANAKDLLLERMRFIDHSLKVLAQETQQFCDKLQEKYDGTSSTIVRPFSGEQTGTSCSANINLQNTTSMHVKLKHKELRTAKVVTLQANGKLGIENIKIIMEVVIIFMVDIIAIIKSRNWFLLVQTIFKLISYGNIIAVAQQAWQELKEVSQAESQELSNHFAVKLELENDEVELMLEKAVAFIPSIYQLFEDGLETFSRAQGLWKEIKGLFTEEEDPRIEKIVSRLAA